MAKKEHAKYTVYADAPGMQIQGIGRAGIIPQGSIITVADPNFEPRASMYPENDAARAAFDRKRKRVEAEWREKYAAGVNPVNGEVFAEMPSKEQIERSIKLALARVGPAPRRVVHASTDKRLPRLAPGAIMTQAPAGKRKKGEAEEDAAVPEETQGQRASDSA